MPAPVRRGDYGYDAPYALIAFAGVGIAGAIAAIAGLVSSNHQLLKISTAYALIFGGNAISFFYTTRYGKFVVWGGLLDDLHLRGTEQVLDLGCGRGAVLIAVAKRLTTGKVTGIDLWRSVDQSGNAIETTQRNADLEGVRDRVVLETGDIRRLPFADAAFDLIVSSLVIHNVPKRADRVTAVREAMRVLKPGGRIVIADIRTTGLYADTLRDAGAVNVTHRRLGWRFWYGNPIAATSFVAAEKPLVTR